MTGRLTGWQSRLTALVLAAGLLAGWEWRLTPQAVLAAEEKPVAGEAQPQAGPEAAPADQRLGQLLRVRLPITGATVERLRPAVRRVLAKAAAENARPVLIFEFDLPSDQNQYGRGSTFGAAYELADFISGKELTGATTVAYIPRSIQGHAVLPVMACDRLQMAADAEIGAAGIDEVAVTPTMLSAYKEIANRRKTLPADLAVALLDPSVELLEVSVAGGGRQILTPAGLAEVKKDKQVLGTKTLKPAGQRAQFSGAELRLLTFAEALVESRRDVARALDLPPEAVEEDPSLFAAWKTVRVELKGLVRPEMIDQAQRLIRESVRDHEVNFVCVWIDSAGGSPQDSMRLAHFLAFDLDPSRVRSVAYIPARARADAALVALACDQILIHPDTILGGSGDAAMGPEDVRLLRQQVLELMLRKSRSWSLPLAMIDPRVEVFRFLRPEQSEYFCQEELHEQKNPDQWQKGETVHRPGRPLELAGRKAVEYRLAHHTVESFHQFKEYYGLENDPRLLEPGWADLLVDALASPVVAGILLTIAFAAMYAELHAPGTGVGGFVATVCFLLFFWSRYLGGTAGWLEVTCFLAGLVFVLLEIFVLPGFGVFGLGGGALILASLILASQTFIFPHTPYQFEQLQHSLWMVGASIVGMLVLASVLRRWLPRASGLNKMVLQPPSPEESQRISQRESLLEAESLVGARGVTTTPLMPGGKARFGNRLLDVMAEGEAIARGAEVVVVEVHGNRIVVQPASE